jgi:hypothetical protein
MLFRRTEALGRMPTLNLGALNKILYRNNTECDLAETLVMERAPAFKMDAGLGSHW